MSYGLGRIYSPDSRDDAYRMRAMPKLAPPRPRKRPYRLGPTRDQDDTPQCVGYSSRHKLDAAPIMVKPNLGVEPVDIYHGAQDNDEWPGNNYDGTSVRGAFIYLVSLGYISSYVWAKTVDEADQFIWNGYGTIVDGTNWYNSMFYLDDKGYARLPRRGSPVGGHAYHHFWTDPTNGDGWYQNSWSENKWGMVLNGRGGCFKITRADRIRLLREEGEAGAGIEHKVVIK